jgi:hypothetical protein
MKGQETCRSNFADDGGLTQTMSFGNIALHVNRNLTMDPVTRTTIGDEVTVALMGGPKLREVWTDESDACQMFSTSMGCAGMNSSPGRG